MDRHEKIKKECLEYFRQSPVWKKVLEGFWEKYRSYGKFSGKVVLRNLKTQELEELEGFFGKNYHGQKNVTISAEKFRQILENSRYKEMTPECLLESFVGKPLIGKQEQKALREHKKQNILQAFQKDYQGTPAGLQLAHLLRIVKDNENTELEVWNQTLRFCADIYNQLPYRLGKKMYLAVFAAIQTGNPHAFDHGTANGTLLYQIIQMDLEIRKIKIETSEIFPAYKRQKSYLLAGVMLDDISNYAMLYQVQAVKKNGDLHLGMKGFSEERHIVQVPLAVIADWSELNTPQKEVYIVENPSIFAILCGKNDEEQEESAYMCMNGQPRLAGLMVLDLFAKAGTTVYYSGDLDPEGLLIAQKLAQYYEGEFHYWHMSVVDYEKSISREIISQKRMKILDRITDERLLPVAERMKVYGKAGYQELIHF